MCSFAFVYLLIPGIALSSLNRYRSNGGTSKLRVTYLKRVIEHFSVQVDYICLDVMANNVGYGHDD